MVDFPYQTIYVSSRDCEHIGDSSTKFYLRMVDTLHPHPNSRIAVTAALVPHTWHDVREPYTGITLEEDGVQIPLTLTEGSYTGTDFDTHIGNVLTAGSVNGWTYTHSTDSNTGLGTLAVSGPTTETISLVFADTHQHSAGLLGHKRDTSVDMTPGNSHTITSPNTVRTDGVHMDHFTISCQQIEPSFLDSRAQGTQRILFSHSLQGRAGEIESIIPQSLQKSEITRPFNRLDFEISDGNKENPHFNGQHVVFVLQLFAPAKTLIRD